MKNIFSFLLLLLINIVAKAQIVKNNTDTSRSEQSTTAELIKPPIDSSILIVVNGTITGTIRELKKDINKLFPADLIEKINVLKGLNATGKYGQKTSSGVLEIYLKDVVKISDINAQNSSQKDSDKGKADTEPSFPGGNEGWINFLMSNLNANVPVEEGAPTGTYKIFVEFLVDENGTVSDIKPLTNHGYGMEKEVIKLISKGPKWVPAQLNGNPVRAYRKQPVTFVVESDELELSTYSIVAGQSTIVEIMNLDYVKDEEIEVTISYGTITHDSGKKYIITADKPGKIILTVKNKAKKKKDQFEYGSAEIEVK